MSDLNLLTLDQIRQCLLLHSGITHDLPDIWADDFQQAAVLIPFVKIKNQWHLVFIRRALHEKDPHGGQVAFAGGKYEQHDKNLQATALREAHEEIGLIPLSVTILGELNFHHSISRYQITPVVAFTAWPFKLVLDQLEVARVFTIPLNWLANPDHHRIELHQHAETKSFPVVYFDEYDGELLWGATARMTLTLISQLNL